MPKFKYQFSREYTIREGFDRIIDAPSFAEAEAAAANLAVGFNHDCPDDCSEIGDEGAGAFTADCETVHGAPSTPAGNPDFVVQPDGQVVDYDG